MKVTWTSSDGAVLKKARTGRALTQADVASTVGCTGSRISELERNRMSGGRPTAPSARLYQRLMNLFPELEQSPSEKPPDGKAVTGLDSQQKELVGRALLEAELVREGFEVARPLRDRGIDLVVYAVGPFKAVPIQVKVKTAEGFDLSKKYSRYPELILAYVWRIHETQRFFL